MNYKIIRLDKRYAYYKQFPYLIEFHKNPSWAIGTTAGSGVLDFDRCRKWFNETWGWSQEVDTRREMIASKGKTFEQFKHDFSYINTDWAWSCRYQEYRIYVSNSALTMFELRWRQTS
jgi:hypothetical protein